MSEKITKLIEEVKSLSVLELSELSKALEEEFGVTASMPVAVAATPGQATEGEKQEEKTEFTLELKSAGGNKIPVVKAVKELTGLGLKEAKALVDGAPKTLKENVSKDVAEETIKKFADIGAEVVMK